MKSLIVYNICGIANRQDLKKYEESLDSIVSQNDFHEKYDLVISSCKSSPTVLEYLKGLDFNPAIYEISDVVPVNVSFNSACLKAKELNKEDYVSYIYVDSAVFLKDPNSLNLLVQDILETDSAMTCTMVENDMNLKQWELEIEQENSNRYNIPVGKATNLHFQAFSKELVDFYGKPVPDIFASFCTESTFSFMCAALQKSWTILKNIEVGHRISMDGASSGFNPKQAHITLGTTADHGFAINSILDRLLTQEAHDYGFGYEEFRGIMIHDPECYDSNGYCKNDDLKTWIKDKLFLSEQEFNYEEMSWELIN